MDRTTRALIEAIQSKDEQAIEKCVVDVDRALMESRANRQLDSFLELLNRCKAGVFISVNEHRNYYESVQEHLADEDVPPDVLDRMVDTDTVIEIQADTPVGCYRVFNYRLDHAIDEILRSMHPDQDSNL